MDGLVNDLYIFLRILLAHSLVNIIECEVKLKKDIYVYIYMSLKKWVFYEKANA